MLLTIIVFILILGLIVFVHELGHFFTAKRFGVEVEEFGFGFPPRLLSKKVKGTIYSLNLIPLGGFVKIKGEAGGQSDDQDSFVAKPAWQKIIILASGVIMNVFLTAIILSLGFSLGFPTVLDENNQSQAKANSVSVQVIDVLPNSPAALAELRPGDKIIKVDNYTILSITGLQEYIKNHSQDELLVLIQRNKQYFDFKIKPQILDQVSSTPNIGVSLVTTGVVAYPWPQAIYKGWEQTIILTYRIIAALIALVGSLVLTKTVALEVTGPVGIAVLTGQALNLGFVYILQFIALLSLNLAIINFLPLPALDGGRILLVIINKLKRQAINQKLEAIIHSTGYIFLIFLMAAVTIKDFSRYQQLFKRLVDKIINLI